MQMLEFMHRTSPYAALAVPGLPALLAPLLGLRLMRTKPPGELTTGRLTLASLWMSTLASIWLCIAWANSSQHALEIHILEIRIASEHGFDVTLMIDALSLTMMLLTSVIALLVGRFSIHYLHREPGFHRYFVILNVFVAAMTSNCMPATKTFRITKYR